MVCTWLLEIFACLLLGKTYKLFFSPLYVVTRKFCLALPGCCSTKSAFLYSGRCIRYYDNYPASNALTDSGNEYWVATWNHPPHNTGKTPSYFVIDLQCEAEITTVHLRNSYGLKGNE